MQWSLLETLAEPQRREFLSACRERRFTRGEVLFHDGDLADSVYLLRSGTAAVSITTPLGETATITVVGPGASFGEVALVGEPTVRSATVTALEPCEALRMPAAAFERLRREHPAVERWLLEFFAGEIRRLTAQLVEALYLPADRRVLRRLLDLCPLYDTDASAAVVVPVTQVMLANMAGTTRVTANQALQRAKTRGAITLSRGTVSVIDHTRLTQLAQ